MLLSLLLAAQAPQISLADIQRQIAYITEGVKDGENWTTLEGDHITLNYVSSKKIDKDTAVGYRDMIEGCLLTDCKTLKTDPPNVKVVIYLYPSAEELGKAVGIPKLPVGLSFSNWSAIVDDPKGITPDLKGNSAEEMGRALIHMDLGAYGCPIVSDGLVSYLRSSYFSEPWISQPAPKVKTPLRDMVQAGTTTTADVAHGASFCAYLVAADNGDPTRLKQFVTAISKERLADLRSPGKMAWTNRVNEACNEVYGKSLDAIEADWRAKYH